MDIFKLTLVMFVYSMFLNPCICVNLKLFNASKIQNEERWQTTTATWYGAADGAGTDGGACGYGNSVENPPLSKMISAGDPSLFNHGEGRGACYEVNAKYTIMMCQLPLAGVKCPEKAACSGNPVTVMITDECHGCPPLQFDLSGTAFGSMANSGQADNLRNYGQINVQFKRVACSFGPSIVFTIDSGANPYYFATEIEYENGDGDLVEIQLKQDHASETWLPMQRSWGARWASSSSSGLQPPFSIMLTQAEEGTNKTIVADSVIPINWQPSQVYRSVINF